MDFLALNENVESTIARVFTAVRNAMYHAGSMTDHKNRVPSLRSVATDDSESVVSTIFVDDVLGFDVAFAPFPAALIAVKEDGLEDVG